MRGKEDGLQFGQDDERRMALDIFKTCRALFDQLNNVCLERPLSLEEPKVTSLTTSVAETNASLDCEEDPASCILNVVEYESKNAGAKYGMQTGKFAAKAASDTLKEVLKSAKDIALRGTIAFAWVGAAISAFFPRAALMQPTIGVGACGSKSSLSSRSL